MDSTITFGDGLDAPELTFNVLPAMAAVNDVYESRNTTLGKSF